MFELFPPPADRWQPAVARRLSGRDEAVYRAHLVGSDPALTKEGGGNFSAKGTALDHRGRLGRVLWMSAWGCDGATATAADFPALRLDDLLRLRDSGPLGEVEMIEYLVDSGLRGEQRRPGIETLTHAFIPAPYVDHCHPDAVITLTSFPGGRAAADAEFGEEAIWFDYRQFDVDVARELADRISANPRCRFVLLANHGLFTWAETSEQCYRNSLEAVARATRAVEKSIRRPADLGGSAVPPVPAEAGTELLTRILPALRGTMTAAPVLHVDRSPEAVSFASSVRGPQLSQAGPSCPDHVVTVGYRPLVLDRTPEDAGQVLAAVERHRAWYAGYFERYVPLASRALGKRDDAPRSVILPGLGVVSAGPDAAKARLCADHITQTMTVIRAADAAGGYRTLTEEQGAVDEYWPMMRLKPQLRPDDGPLAGLVFLVAGGGPVSAIGALLAAEGAHVALAGDDGTLAETAAEIVESHGERKAVALSSSPARPGAVAGEAVLAYGGFDALIDLTGDLALTLEALPTFTRQGRPGSVLLVRDEHPDLAALPAGTTVSVIVSASPEAVAATAACFSGPAFTGPDPQPKVTR